VHIFTTVLRSIRR